MTATDLIALYAAIIGTITLGYQVYSSRKKFKVRLLPGVNVDPTAMAVVASLMNTGSQPLYLRNFSFVYPYKKSNIWQKIRFMARFRRSPKFHNYVHTKFTDQLTTPLPCDIDPGNSIQIWAFPEHFPKTGDKFSRIAVCVQDALGRNYYSNTLDIDYLKLHLHPQEMV